MAETTVPYLNEGRPNEPESASTRLIIALSCEDPLRLDNDWPLQSIDLTDVHNVGIGRGDQGFELTHSQVGPGGLIMLSMPDPHMSVHHSRIIREPGNRWSVADMGSTNGTWVNGRRVEEATLVDNDVLALGSTILLFRSGRAASGANTDALATQPEDSGDLYTLNAEMAASVASLRDLAPSDLPVVITGETGTGKEVLARAIHDRSGRPGPFVAVNCGAFSPGLITSELFGVVRGAYSGATGNRPGVIRRAHQGTLLLDEIAELPADCQASFLRVLQDKQVTPVGSADSVAVDVRVLAATHQDLDARVRAGSFRQDLLARLRGSTVALPPLRARREDIGLLIARLLPRCVGDRAVGMRLSQQAAAQMFMYHWPDNVRELEKAVHAAALISRDGMIRIDDLPAVIAEAGRNRTARPAPSQEERLPQLWEQYQGNVSEVARALGTSRTQVRRLLERLGIRPAGKS